jgi:hypothetical protein
MSFQLTFLGYYSIKSPQLKKQTQSVKRRNWSHRERTAQADSPRWTAKADGAAVRLRRTALEDGPGGRRTATPSGSQKAVGPLRPSVAAADGLTVRQADGRQGGRPWDRRMRPDVRWMRPWTSGRVTTLHMEAQVGFLMTGCMTWLMTWSKKRSQVGVR